MTMASMKPLNFADPLPSLADSSNEGQLDAGLRSFDHYRTKLPLWRYLPRQLLLPLVRWETPWLAALQSRMRSPTLDTLFSFSANLGTHTFFMIFLPVLFWCGHTALGRAFVNILASGVFFSGFLKDLLCLPRPLSPPLRRITMSHSVALEYGFPSTHSANALSVAAYCLLLSTASSELPPRLKITTQVSALIYASIIVMGRLYCGMHGFLDVVVGSALGIVISLLQYALGDDLDRVLYTGSVWGAVLAAIVILILVRLHPEPVDDCPCFDDSVAFAGVVIGIVIGSWRFAQSNRAELSTSILASIPYDLDRMGWTRTVLRVGFGILIIVGWREAMKPLLLQLLPPVFRVIHKLGLNFPRRFFIQASQYTDVPADVKDDNVFPSVSELPSLLTTLRHPRRHRSVSVGPQSEADAYEALAFREKQRRDTLQRSRSREEVKPAPDYFSLPDQDQVKKRRVPPHIDLPNPNPALIEAETAFYTPQTPLESNAPSITLSKPPETEDPQADDKARRDMFAKLQKPRVRYDVEVVTKLIVYAGIGWISVEVTPVVFDLVGLGMS